MGDIVDAVAARARSKTRKQEARMAAFKSLVGQVRVRTAGRKRVCHHDRKRSISKGELVLESRAGLAERILRPVR